MAISLSEFMAKLPEKRRHEIEKRTRELLDKLAASKARKRAQRSAHD